LENCGDTTYVHTEDCTVRIVEAVTGIKQGQVHCNAFNKSEGHDKFVKCRAHDASQIAASSMVLTGGTVCLSFTVTSDGQHLEFDLYSADEETGAQYEAIAALITAAGALRK